MDRYQDYVIKEGRFIGKFEEMYQKFDDPWHQVEGVGTSYARHAAILTLRNEGVKSLLEVGSGLGAYTHFLSENLPDIRISGIDISETAVSKAKKAYSAIDFFVGSLLEISKDPIMYDAVLFAEIMWYVLEDIDMIVENLSKNYKGKLLLVNQTFYKNGQQYGNKYFTNLDEMIDFLPWEVLTKIVIERKDLNSLETHSVYRI